MFALIEVRLCLGRLETYMITSVLKDITNTATHIVIST